MVHYGVTKTALLGVARGFAKAVAGKGVTVNTVIAGPTHTEGVEDFVREMVGDDKAVGRRPAGVRRRASPELAARAADRAGGDREPGRVPELRPRVGHHRRRDPRRRRLRRPHPAVIAVTGATGEVGRRVAARLDDPRLVVRDPSRAPAGADVRVASSYGALDEMTEALTRRRHGLPDPGRRVRRPRRAAQDRRRRRRRGRRGADRLPVVPQRRARRDVHARRATTGRPSSTSARPA